MDRTDEPSFSPVSVNGVYSVHRTEEFLLPVITDESLKFTMASPQLPPATSNSAPFGPSELRLVLLGRKGVGKTAAGHTILGGMSGLETWRPTEECVERQGGVVGKTVTVVDTPGWEWYYPLNSTPNWVRRETLRSVSLCPPGPHAVLLVVRACASVTEAYIREIEEHLEPLGRGVWEHTMLLFTRGDELGLTTMEQRILTSGPALQRLLQKCGRRYHVVNNLSRGDATQVQELIRKLEQMVEEKEGTDHLEMDSTLLSGLEADKERRARERRKKQRQMEAQTQKGTITAALNNDAPQGFGLDAHQSFSKSPRRLHEVRLVLLGERETGKSAAGNTILGKNSFFPAGTVTEECICQQAEVTRRLVTVVDTPGWEAGVAGPTPERVKREIVSSVTFCPPGPHALLLTLRVDTLVRVAHVREHLELLGGGVWRHVILLFTHGDQLREGVDIQHHIQSGGRDLQWLLEKCRGRYHVISSVGRAGEGGRHMVTELLEKVEKVVAMNRCEAFSNLVQEVRDLSRQRNEKFSQRLKEMGDKMLRQEEELRNMKEREMKRLSWFVNRKKKAKSNGKVGLQREEEEEEEERRTGETKADFGELEERMQWLLEDKEREIQDLSLENKRNLVTLNKDREEREKLLLRLELRERETEELKERIDEQQAKLLDLERTGIENEHTRKQMEEAVKEEAGRWRKEVEKLRETVEQQEKEVEGLTAEMDETKRHCDAALRRKDQEHVKELKRLQEEVQLKTTEGLKLQHQEEMVRKISELEKLMEKTQVQQQRGTVQKLKEKEKEMERVKKKHENEISRLKEQFVKESEKHLEAKEEELQKRYENQIKKKSLQSEKEKEIIISNHKRDLEEKMQEKEEEIEQLKRQHHREMSGKLKEMEKEQRENEESVKNLQQDYEKKMKEMQELNQSEAEEKKKLLKEVKKREKEMTELEGRFLDQLEEKMLESEIEREIIVRNHQKQLEQTLQMKEKELEELKTQHREEMEKREDDMTKLQTVIEGKEAEREEAVKKIKDAEEERTRENEQQRARFSTEMQKQIEEKQREIKELEQKLVFLMEEKRLQHEREKELIHQCQEELVEELQSRYIHEIEELKRESEEQKRSYKREMEKKEGEAEEARMNLKRVEEKLQKEQEKNRDHEDNVREIRHQLEEKDEEMETVKESVRKVKEELQQKDEEIRELLSHREEMEKSLEDRDGEMKTTAARLQQLQETVQRMEEEKQRNLSDQERQTRIKLEEREELVLKQQKRETEQQMKEMERVMEEKTVELVEMERKVKEKEREIGHLKEQAATTETRWREEQEQEEEKRGTERKQLLEAMEWKTKAMTEAQHLLEQRNIEVNKATQTCADYQQEIQELRESWRNQRRIKDEEVMEKEQQLEKLRQKDEENQSEILQLKLKIEQTKSELKDLTTKMEKETMNMIQEYEKEIKRRNKLVETISEEKKEATSRLEEERRRNGQQITEKYEESLQRVEELQEKNEEMRKELENFKLQYDELRKESEVVRKYLKRAEEQVQNKESEIQQMSSERDTEVKTLKSQLQEGMELLRTRSDEEKQQLRGGPEKGQGENQSEFRFEKFLQREKEMCEREENLCREEEKLKKRELLLKSKEAELDVKEEKLDGRRHELTELQENLEKERQIEQEKVDRYEQEVRKRDQDVQRKEEQIESLLRALEGKQQELSFHGEDLQKKVKGLKEHSKELRDREHHLINEEQELLNWKSELQVRDDRVNSTTLQLDEMGRDLTLLKEELHKKEANMKMFLEKLNKWQQSLEARESEFQKKEEKGLESVEWNSSSNNRRVEGEGQIQMYQEVSERREEGRGKESDKGGQTEEREDLRRKIGESATNSLECQCETLTETEVMEEREEMGGGDEGRREVRRVNQDLLLFSQSQGHRRSNSKDSPGSYLRVIVLGETWSPRSPAGVTILGGEDVRSKEDGSTFRSWRGQIGGRNLAVAEPLGLRWRDGPDLVLGLQKKSLLDCRSWCHPGPHIVLLIIPAFLTCTQKYRRALEEQLGLLGEDTWQRTLVVFTWGDTLGVSAEQHILRNGELMTLVEKCGGRFHVLSNKKKTSQGEELLEKMEALTSRGQGL